jgi:hypothetical protein
VTDPTFSFPVSVHWPGGKHVIAQVEAKPSLAVATPPEFKGTYPAEWSPEDVLVSNALAIPVELELRVAAAAV